MIRQWTIVAALGILLAMLSWNFIHRVVLYDPMAGITQTGQAKQQENAVAASHKKAWGKDIKEKNLFSQQRMPAPVRRVGQAPEPVGRTPVRPPEPMPAIILNGIIKNTDGSYAAYIKVGDKPTMGMRIGDVMHGVSIITIEERQVELKWQNNKLTMKMQSSPLIKKR